MPGMDGGAARGDPCPDADVLILALGRPAETEAAIRSALAQTGVALHVYVLDQGSSPPDLARLAAVVDGRADATLLPMGRNHGVAGGRNLAAALGRGRVIVALDNDAVFDDPTTLARAVAALDEAPDLAATGFRIVVDATGADDLSSWGYPLSLLPRAAHGFDAATFVGAGHAIRRTAWDQAGGYDAALFFCWEEYDFCLRAIDLGWRVRYRGDLVVRHKVSPDRRVGWSEARWFYYVRNRLYLGRKWGAGWPALGLRFALYLLKGARNGQVGQILRAWPAAVRLSRGAPRRRLSVQARAYLHAADAAHRASPVGRLRQEVLAVLPRG